MRKLFIITFLILLVSCGGLPADNSAPPIDNGLWTLEMAYEDKRDVGLLGATFDEATMGNEFFEIPLWGKGSYNIRSKRCAYSDAQFFDIGKKVSTARFHFSDLVENMPEEETACVFNVQLFVEGLDKGLQGQFYLLRESATKDKAAFQMYFLGQEFEDISWAQVSDLASTELPVIFGVDQAGELSFKGCGREDEISFAGTFQVPLKFFVGKDPKPCVYTIGITLEDGSVGFMEFNLKVFKHQILQLPKPQITYKKRFGYLLSAKAGSPVAYMAIGEKFKKGKKIKKYVKMDEEVWIRYGTANGRYNLLKVKNGEIIWEPSILF